MRSLALAYTLPLLASPACAETVVTVTQITREPQHHYFGYIVQSRTIPWSAHGRYVLAPQVGFQDRLPSADEPADVSVLDARDNYAIRVLGRTRVWNLQ